MVVKTQGKITQIKQLSSSVNHFTLQVDEAITYESGQFINLIYEKKNSEGENEKIRRSYSIASKPHNNESKELELCIKLVEDGTFTPLLFDNNVTNLTFQVMAPLGLFKLRGIEENKHQVFIGAGTGIAPLRSFILDLLENKHFKSQITLLLGIRFEHEILYLDEFKKLEEEHFNFTFIPCISRPTNNWSGRVGYVQEHIIDIENLLHSEFYICGLTALVNECEEKLQELDVSKENIKSEKYG